MAATLRASSVYNGQASELQVAVTAEEEQPIVNAPNVDGADLTLFGTETQPHTVGAIGDQVTAQTISRFRYRLIPRKVGLLLIPAFKANTNLGRGTSASIRLKVAELPRQGRTSDFLGGIGAFNLAADVKPDSIRLGHDFEYRIVVEGPAARGCRERPGLGQLRRSHPGLQIISLPDAVVDEPPSRTFTWKIRPGEAGEFKLPPVSIAAFDPLPGRYITKTTSGVTVKVSDVLAFDSSVIDYGPDLVASDGVARPFGWLVGIIGGVAAAFMIGRGRRRRIRSDPRDFVSALQERLLESGNAVMSETWSI